MSDKQIVPGGRARKLKNLEKQNGLEYAVMRNTQIQIGQSARDYLKEFSSKALVLLAANLEGFESVIDHDHELRLWRALSQMMRNGADAIDFFVGDVKPALAIIKQ